MKIRMTVFMLGMIIALTTLAGCGSKFTETEESTAEVIETVNSKKDKEDKDAEVTGGKLPADYFAGTELTVAIVRQADDQSISFQDKTIMKNVTEATGIKVNFIEVDIAVKDDRLTAMMTSGELPDIIMGFFNNDSRISSFKDLFYDLSEEGLMETYAPDVLATYEAGGLDIWDMLTLEDGSVRSLACGASYSADTDYRGLWYVNKKWLQNVGKEAPSTAEEFYDVMCAFRDQDANGNGDPTDEIPITFVEAVGANASFMNLANSFGIAGVAPTNEDHYYYLEDGTIKSTLNTEEFRAFLEWAHQYAEEGLLDMEGFSQPLDQYKAKILADKVGMFIEFNPSGIGVRDEDWVCIAPFQVMEGVVPVKTGAKNSFIGNLTGFVISSDSENVEAALHWWNVISGSLENRMSSRRGQLGKGWYYAEDGSGKAVFGSANDMTIEEIQKYISSDNLGVTASAYLSLADYTMVVDPENMTIRQKYYPLYNDMLTREFIPVKIVEEEAVFERNLLEVELLPMISNFIAISVTEGMTDDSWDQFQDDLDTYGYYEWITWWQNYVDSEIESPIHLEEK